MRYASPLRPQRRRQWTMKAVPAFGGGDGWVNYESPLRPIFWGGGLGEVGKKGTDRLVSPTHRTGLIVDGSNSMSETGAYG